MNKAPSIAGLRDAGDAGRTCSVAALLQLPLSLQATLVMQAGLARAYMYSHAAQILTLESEWRTHTHTHTHTHTVAALLHLCCRSFAAVACLQCALGGSVVYNVLGY